jgi:DNA-binding CsgD family transcriptional regulator
VLGRALAADPAVDPTVVAHHLLAAGDEAPPAEVASAALRGGLAALAQHAYADADRLLEAAGQRVPDAAGAGRVRLTLQLGRARARRGLGDLAEASRLAAAAARLAEALGDADAFAEAAVLRAYPPDWHDDDVEARGLLARADRAPTGPVWRARVRASRARIEMRSPARHDALGQVWSWETHPTVARPMAEEAVELARTSGDPESLVVALLAWRSNHRAPGFLALRRRASDEAVRIASRLGDAALLHEAALRAFTDRLEAGERDGAEEAARLVRRSAEREVEPRLVWRAGCLDVTLAWLDGDLSRAREARERVIALARDERIPGGDQVAAMLLGQELLLGGAFATLLDGLGGDHPSLLHPLGLAGRAMACAGVGDRDGARAALDRLPDPPDPEASLLAVTTFAARAVVAIGDADRARHHLALLDPWRDRAATDSEGIVVPVPVASVTARLRDLTGDVDGAREDRTLARGLAARLRAAPEVAITEPLAAGGAAPGASVLSPRQVAVLARLAEGRSNAQIAEELHFGVATISRETSAIYRALGAANRAEAVRAAVQRGLLPGR